MMIVAVPMLVAVAGTVPGTAARATTRSALCSITMSVAGTMPATGTRRVGVAEGDT